MMMDITKAKMGNALTSVADNHVVATADDIYDETADKYQNELNQDFESRIADIEKNGVSHGGGSVDMSQVETYITNYWTQHQPQNGISPTIKDGYWYVGTVNTGVKAQGAKGDKGDKGADGADGKDGKGIQIKGNLNTYAELGTVKNPQEGDCYNVDGVLYNYDGVSWNNLGRLQGERGEKGDKGDKGKDGADGTNGFSQYMFIRYANNAVGTGYTHFPQTDTTYIGIAVVNEDSAPDDSAGNYRWIRVKGDKGDPVKLSEVNTLLNEDYAKETPEIEMVATMKKLDTEIGQIDAVLSDILGS